jgi:subtilisin family serine protease
MSRKGPALCAPGVLAAALWAVLGTQVAASAATSAPNDPWFATGRQWGLTQAGFPWAWCTSTGAGALIVVIDGGIDASHPDLAGKVVGSYAVTNGRVVTGGETSDHATHIAGIAAADTNNGTGMAGAAPDARLLSVQVLHSGEQGSATDLATAIGWVADEFAPTWPGPVVLNISVGATTTGTPPRVASAIANAYSRGLGVALAAGDLPGTSSYAPETAQAMVVGALTQTGAVAPYSPTGGVNVFTAGGVESAGGSSIGSGLVSTYTTGQYGWLNGSSMAAPHVAAALAMLMSTGMSNRAAYSRITDSEVGGALRIDRAVGRTGGCGLRTAPASRGGGTALPLTGAALHATSSGAPAGTGRAILTGASAVALILVISGVVRRGLRRRRRGDTR